MDRLPDWARRPLEWLWRVKARIERIPWHPWISVPLLVAVVLFVLWNGSVCDPRSVDPVPHPVEEQMVPASTVQRIAENMAETRLSWIDRLIRGYESRPPERIFVTDTLVAPPPICAPAVVIADNRLSTPVYSQATGGWEVKLVEDVDVTGCDGLRIVGETVICDGPGILGKLSLVGGGSVGAPTSVLTDGQEIGLDAYAGLSWQKHRDSRLSVAALYGVDQTIRLRAEYRVNLW